MAGNIYRCLQRLLRSLGSWSRWGKLRRNEKSQEWYRQATWMQRAAASRFAADAWRAVAIALILACAIGLIFTDFQAAATHQQLSRPISLKGVIELIWSLGGALMTFAVGLNLVRTAEVQSKAATNPDARRLAWEHTIISRCLSFLVAMYLIAFLYFLIAYNLALPI